MTSIEYFSEQLKHEDLKVWEARLLLASARVKDLKLKVKEVKNAKVRKKK